MEGGVEHCVDGYVMTLTRLRWIAVRSVSDEFVMVSERGSDSPIVDGRQGKVEILSQLMDKYVRHGCVTLGRK
jgi:hypothetical protein